MARQRTRSKGVATAPGRVVTLQLIAENMAFSVNSLRVPASAPVKIIFDNKDDDIPHNFSLYTDETATEKLFTGKIITGPARTEYEFTAPGKAGSYFFRCDVHPTIMTGKFIVEENRELPVPGPAGLLPGG